MNSTASLLAFARLVVGVVGVAALGCSGTEGGLGVRDTSQPSGTEPSEPAPSEPDPSMNDDSPTLPGAADAVGTARPRVVLPYPPAPYGSAVGSTIANFEFFGWDSPAAFEFKSENARRLSFAEYYDPEGTKGYEALFISAVATWCGVCRQEYTEFQTSGIQAELAARGVVFFGTLFENQDAEPPGFRDLEAWVEAFDVNFPFASDPGLKLGVFFDRAATPMNMVVDLRNMEILLLQTGYSSEVLTLLDEFLTNRNR